MTDTDSGTGHILTGLKQFVKRYCIYDVQYRPIDVYEVAASAPHGTPCLHTQLTYVGVTNRVEKSLEQAGVWDSAWDL